MYRENPFLLSGAIHNFLSLSEFAKKYEVKIVYASTSSIYNGNVPPFHEDMPIYVTVLYAEVSHRME